MKTKKGFKLRTICGENIIVAEGVENIDFSRIISMNESAAFLWKNIQGTDFDAEKLTKLLLEEYEVDESTARGDAQNAGGEVASEAPFGTLSKDGTEPGLGRCQTRHCHYHSSQHIGLPCRRAAV